MNIQRLLFQNMTERRQSLSAKKLQHLTVLTENLEMVESLKADDAFDFDFSKKFSNAFDEIGVDIENSLEDVFGDSEESNNNGRGFFMLEDEFLTSESDESSEEDMDLDN